MAIVWEGGVGLGADWRWHAAPAPLPMKPSLTILLNFTDRELILQIGANTEKIVPQM